MKRNNYSDERLFKEWIKLADDDLSFAKASFKEFDKFYSHICIQAHQATEKYLKGFLIFHKKDFPKIHDLSYLVKECAKIDKDFNKYLDPCKKITDYYIYLRYPITLPPRTEKDAREAIEIAESIARLVKIKTGAWKK